jgi:hypothetical protein
MDAHSTGAVAVPDSAERCAGHAMPWRADNTSWADFDDCSTIEDDDLAFQVVMITAAHS